MIWIKQKPPKRRITTCRKQGELYRRDFEIYQLQLLDPVDVLSLLECVGFSADILNRYGLWYVPQGLYGFLARKAVSTGTQQAIPADNVKRAEGSWRSTFNSLTKHMEVRGKPKLEKRVI